jgi:hypothetical protein
MIDKNLRFGEERVRTVAIAQIIGLSLGVALALGALGLELRYRKRPQRQLEVTRGNWQLDFSNPQRYLLTGELALNNRSSRLAIVIPELTAHTQLLSKESVDSITCQTRVIPLHPDATARPDEFWFAYLMPEAGKSRVKVAVEIAGEDLSALQSAWVRVQYIEYGSIGCVPQEQNIVLPLQYPQPVESPQWKEKEQGVQVLPIKTHLLSHIDDPVEVIRRYVLPYSQPGDIVTIGESPLAIIQEQWMHPNEVQLGWVASRFCYYFNQKASISTAYGLQSLVDQVGPLRVVFAFVAGVLAKVVLKRPGAFYELAGEPARLIDDVTGTLPPYDRFIVLGPKDSQQVVDLIKKETGLDAAIVDVNDLKAVKILAATAGTSVEVLEAGLRSNPAGNADEQTPLVLIRPKR